MAVQLDYISYLVYLFWNSNTDMEGIIVIVNRFFKKLLEVSFYLASTRKLKRLGVDLLACRAQLKHLHLFMATEIPSQFNLKMALKTGMLAFI